jgi:hypothetical protein
MEAATPTTEHPKSAMLQRSRKWHTANAIRHGMRGSALPPGCSYIEKAINHFRRQLEKAVIDLRGEITLVDSAVINSAYRFERLAQLAQRWLVANYDEMNYSERLAVARESAEASAKRDKCIEKLRLDQRPDNDFWNGTLPPTESGNDHPASDHSANGSHSVSFAGRGKPSRPPIDQSPLDSGIAVATALDGSTSNVVCDPPQASPAATSGEVAEVIADSPTSDQQPAISPQATDDGEPNRWPDCTEKYPTGEPFTENGVSLLKTVAQNAPRIAPTRQADL